MFEEQLNLLYKGEVKIYAIRGKSRELIYENYNLIVENAKKILVHAIGGDNFIINKIQVYKTSVQLAEDDNLIIEYPIGDKSIKFFALFDETSFNDTLDEIMLVSTNGGLFAQIMGLSHTQDCITQLQIEWKIIFNII